MLTTLLQTVPQVPEELVPVSTTNILFLVIAVVLVGFVIMAIRNKGN